MSLSPKTIFLAATFAGIVVAPCFVAAGDARAQAIAPPVTNYPPCTTKPTPQDSEAAHSAFLLGRRFFEESDYATASHNFQDAFKLDCTKPDLLMNIARANELLGNRAEAIHALETYLTLNQTLSPEDRSQIQRRIDNLKAAMAAQAAAVVPVVVAPVVAPPPQITTPPPAPPEERHHTIWPWVVVGVGGAAAIAGGALFFVGVGDVSSAEKTCPNGDCTKAPSGTTTAQMKSAASDGNTGDTLRTAGAAVFWSGIAVVGGGVLWHFLEPTGPASKDAAPKASLTPVLGPGFGGVAAVGTF